MSTNLNSDSIIPYDETKTKTNKKKTKKKKGNVGNDACSPNGNILAIVTLIIETGRPVQRMCLCTE